MCEPDSDEQLGKYAQLLSKMRKSGDPVNAKDWDAALRGAIRALKERKELFRRIRELESQLQEHKHDHRTD